jgi:streptogramin lyase
MKWFHSAGKSLRRSSRETRRAPRRNRPLAVENLEGRRLPSGAIQPVTLPAGVPPPTEVISGPGGDQWVGVSRFPKPGRTAIDWIGLDGSVTSFAVPGHFPIAWLGAGPDGKVWFIADTDPSRHGSLKIRLGNVTPAGQFTEFAPVPLPIVRVQHTAGSGWISNGEFISGPGGDLWFGFVLSDFVSSPRLSFVSQDFIGRVTTAGKVKFFPVSSRYDPTSASERTPGIDSLAAGVDGDLWFTQQIGQHKELVRMSPSGVVTHVPVPGLSPTLWTQVAPGPGPSLILTAVGLLRTQAILRISMAGVVAPFDLRAANPYAFQRFLGPADGSLWFTGGDTGNSPLLGRITDDGAATSYDLSRTIPGRIGSVAAGLDGNLYLLEQDNITNTVYRLSPGELDAVH